MIPRGLLDLCLFNWACQRPFRAFYDRRLISSTSHVSLHPSSPRSESDKHSYADTLFLPKTTFPLRANAAAREPRFRGRTTEALYRWQEQQKERPIWILHDGPPYANGNLHAGHALNKILKDMINRSKLIDGYRVNYIPGYDTHGLPLELKAIAKSDKSAADLAPQTIRKLARETALEGIALQAAEFKEFGCMASFDENDAYKTLNWTYERRQLRVVRDMVAKGLIISRTKPTLYSPSSRTALAEAELEYREDHKSQSVYVLFEIQNPTESMRQSAGNQPIHLLVWTTTPWTLPSNMAVAVSSNLEYTLVRDQEGRSYIISADRRAALSELFETQLETLCSMSGRDLLSIEYKTGLSDDVKPVILGKHVTSTTGTGLVHTAPSHGVEDWEAWNAARPGSETVCAVDATGAFSESLSQLVKPTFAERLLGQPVLGTGNKEVLEMLRQNDTLLKQVAIEHKYPYDWRTKQPVIFRASQQWFANLDGIKDAAIASLNDVRFVPERGRNTLQMYVEGRSEWCISRQRAWGVPIPVVYSTAVDGTDERPHLTPSNIEHIIGVLDAHGGTDYWWQGEAEEFVEPSELERSKAQGREWRKGVDTLDVWFDSGCSWTLLRELSLRSGDQPYADLYLEGSDQHRGWFQSSLLTAIASSDSSKPKAPYGSVLTHGMVLDEKGRKMSKSLGNVVSPLSVIHGSSKKEHKSNRMPAYGVDLLRLWVASVDSTRDVPMGPQILAQISESLRKIRNTARFMIGSIRGSSAPVDGWTPVRLIDRYLMHELYQFDQACRAGYRDYTFNKIYQAVTSFATTTLSSLYFDVIKDSLYADDLASDRRRDILRVLQNVLGTYTMAIAPITPHLAEEIRHFASGAEADPIEDDAEAPSVFHQVWKPVPEVFRDQSASDDMTDLLVLRNVVQDLLERVRSHKLIRSSSEAQIWLETESPLIEQYREELAELLAVSSVKIATTEQLIPEEARYQVEGLETSRTLQVRGHSVNVRVSKSERQKCPRCWLHTRPLESSLCHRCEQVVKTN